MARLASRDDSEATQALAFALCEAHSTPKFVSHRLSMSTQDPRAYWQSYVDGKGGVAKAAETLKIPYSTIAGICNGSRGIGHDLAERMAKADDSLDPMILVWVRPQPKAAA